MKYNLAFDTKYMKSFMDAEKDIENIKYLKNEIEEYIDTYLSNTEELDYIFINMLDNYDMLINAELSKDEINYDTVKGYMYLYIKVAKMKYINFIPNVPKKDIWEFYLNSRIMFFATLLNEWDLAIGEAKGGNEIIFLLLKDNDKEAREASKKYNNIDEITSALMLKDSEALEKKLVEDIKLVRQNRASNVKIFVAYLACAVKIAKRLGMQIDINARELQMDLLNDNTKITYTDWKLPKEDLLFDKMKKEGYKVIDPLKQL